MIILAFKYFFLSLKTHRTRKVIWVTILSIGFSLGTLITSISIMNGFQNAVLERILHIYGHMDVYSNNIEKKINLIKKKPWYRHHIKINEKQGILSYNNDTNGVKVIGINQANCDYIIQNKWVKKNSRIKPTVNTPTVAVGYKLANELGLSINSNIKLFVPYGVLSSKIAIKTMDAKVSGIFHLGFHSFDRNVIFIFGNELDKYSLGFEQKQYVFYTKTPDKIDQIQKDLYESSGKSYSIWTWKDTNPSLKQMFSMQNIVLAIFIGMFVLCGIMQSTNSLWMLISERAQDISLLKAFGASNKQIFSLFAYVALFISIGSVLFGLLFASLLIYIFPRAYHIIHKSYGYNMIHEESFGFSAFYPKIYVMDLVLISGIAFLIMMVILMFIARKSNDLEIVEGLN